MSARQCLLPKLNIVSDLESRGYEADREWAISCRKKQDAPDEVLAGLSEICPTCGLKRPGITKQFSKPVKEILQPNLDVQYVNVYSASGKVDAKDSTKVRAYVMRHFHRNIQDSWDQAMSSDSQRAIQSGRICVTTVWPGLRGSSYSVAYAREWLPIAARNPVFLHVLLFAASAHLEALRGSGAYSDSKGKIRLEQLHQKGEAIRGIHDALRDGKDRESDELIQSILFLAINETKEDEEPADWSPFSPPFRSLQWLDIYGTQNYSMPHIVAVQDIIRKRGGIRNIHTIGLAWLISCSELIYCAATLSQPQHPLLDPFGQDIEFYPLATSSKPSAPKHHSDITASGLSYLQISGLCPEITDVFLKLRDYSEAIELYEGVSVLPEFMADNRNWVLHRLLSLPSASVLLYQAYTLSEEFHRTMLCYEACRLAAMMYCIHVVFPTPRSLHGRKMLLPLMKEAIQRIDLLMASEELAELVLWCVVIGGIAASGQDVRSWFLIQRNILSTELRLTEWSEVKIVMRKFAWVDSACDPGGKALWNETV
ncbi:hypothetical protein V501_01903 [Pseudogymnoascus sp. VKM F-4519 (FW-2642)]|nr:hypothetical protein V500_03164 [Pseudogymnoascus sp. VKM F-4518 (FW-2643)]KFZ17112.1 hypothetical protein V501_01903 [Pseudogymnoascus sp. VKM F-4519 (FW-2642)]